MFSKSSFRAAALAMTLVAMAACGPRDFPMSTRSDEARSHFQEALRYMDNYMNRQAGESLQKALAADSSFALAYLYRGVLTNNPEERQKLFERARKEAAEASMAERTLIEAVIAWQSKDLDTALKQLETLRETFPNDFRITFTYGRVLFDKGEYPAAAQAFEQAVQLDSTTVAGFDWLANAYIRFGEYEKAKTFYRKAAEVTPEGGNPVLRYYGIAFAELYLGNVDAALAAMEEGLQDYLQRNPEARPVFVYNSMARINLENGRPEKALELYEKGYSLVPNSNMSEMQKQLWLGRLHHGKARSYAKMGDFRNAWKHARIVKKMLDAGGEQAKRFMPAYHYLVGYIYLEQNKPQKALEHLQQADQNDHFIRMLTARAYEMLGQADKARDLYTEIVNNPIGGLERALVYNQAREKLAQYAAQ